MGDEVSLHHTHIHTMEGEKKNKKKKALTAYESTLYIHK